ncbi:hypothetical protein HMPREF9141_0033 [Prevotella multiformis DSM 16608]|uniref:Uncharacterized protein n=1 Tax=Prevotella multiformis DSM 16608 TaxID=888743 RepID=F0F367_9BACT|nr:hypothetical protein HMPREF9141_0033 [Prevotella multiformis DSM 16608]
MFFTAGPVGFCFCRAIGYGRKRTGKAVGSCGLYAPSLCQGIRLG